MVNTHDKEKFIDVLLIVMGLVLAGTSNLQNVVFYYSAFGFLIFAILTRAWMTFKTNDGEGTSEDNTDTHLYDSIYKLFSFFMAVAFPIVFVSYFYSKLSPIGSQWPLFGLLSIITAGLSAFIYMSLTMGLQEGFGLGYITNLLNYINRNRQFVSWLLFFIVITFIDAFILFLYMKANGLNYTIENASVIIDNATVTITNATI